jgi:outer membrane usher protein
VVSAARGAEQHLLLEVTINKIPTNLIGAFTLLESGELAAAPNELEELGLQVDRQWASIDLVRLADIPTLAYHYDEQTQSLHITIDDANRKQQAFYLRPGIPVPDEPASADWGALANYDVLINSGSLLDLAPLSTASAALTIHGRAFSPYGTFEQSAILEATGGQAAKFTRLDSTFRVSDQASLITYKAGDLITGGLPWSRPIRVAGVQAQSNFSLRPDLVTTPLLSLGATAAVPSTVDLYVNDTKAHSQAVDPGPFTLFNVPVVAGPGEARLVVRDASGNQKEIAAPFYASPDLLVPGLSEWSLEAGLPRIGYGSEEDRYLLSPVASATLRRGIVDWLTAEAHAEIGAGIGNGGVGAVFTTGTFGVASASLSASQGPGGMGGQATLGYETSLLGFTISTSFLRTFGAYEDLASATAMMDNAAAAAALGNSGPARQIDRIAISTAIPLEWKPSIGLSYLGTVDAGNRRTDLLNLTYSQTLPFGGSLYANAFHHFGAEGKTGFSMGFNVPLDAEVTMSSGLSSENGGTAFNVDVMKPLGLAPGDSGWRIRNVQGPSPRREASFSYRSQLGLAQIGVSQQNSAFSGSLALRGSVAAMGGGIFMSEWIDDSFAVVDTGVPGVDVLYDNRPVGTTNARGKVLVPRLKSYEANRISIDPTGLPIDAETPITEEVVAPADRAGVTVAFKVNSNADAALVSFVRGDDSLVPAGAAGRLSSGATFTVGYDGQAFIRGLAAENAVTIEFLDGTCRANFSFAPKPGTQVQIGPISCL